MAAVLFLSASVSDAGQTERSEGFKANKSARIFRRGLGELPNKRHKGISPKGPLCIACQISEPTEKRGFGNGVAVAFFPFQKQVTDYVKPLFTVWSAYK